MYVEGALLALPLVVLGDFLMSAPLAAINSTGVVTDMLQSLPWIQRLVLSISAGLYEELVFRMALIALVHAILVDIAGMQHRAGLAIAVVLSAAAFTWYHDPGMMTAAGIVFTALAGLYFGLVYVVRGFGVVVIAHVVYDAVIMLRY